MSYEQFVQKVLEVIKEKVGDQLQASVFTAVKNNGCERKGIAFLEEGADVSPVIYLEDYYEDFQRGTSVESVVEHILELYSRTKKDTVGAETVRDYQNVKDRIIYKLVNREKNRDLLKEAPYIEYMDLAVLFYVLTDLDEAGGQIATMLIRNNHLAYWNVTEGEIRERAEINTPKLFPCEFSTMHEVLVNMVGTDCMEDLLDLGDMYILTNHIRSGGAAAILYPGQLDAIGECLKESYYILPSSIHDVIIVPKSMNLSPENLEEIVQDVNEIEVSDEEILSYSVYYYDVQEGRLMMA